ncbi:MAG: response regulator transcription factor [Chitinophagales bacterium]|nr:response regulator transcription factor [Chitinophagales bacterium]MDW8428806.1 response regulator transcription factor [Chitinophagales bacterium]
MQKPVARILLVEDDANLSFVMKDSLEKRGYQIIHARDGREALEKVNQGVYDLILLDIMLPHVDGLTIAERVRQHNKMIPIFFVSAKSMTEDKLAGFRVGGDDYITKPFNLEELDFKIKVFLRRSQHLPTQDPQQVRFQIGRYFFDFRNLSLKINNQEMTLTLREAEVLLMLCQRQNEVVPRNVLLNHIWGSDDYFLGRSLDVFISRLRKYLKEDPKVQIANIHGVGFKLKVDD